MNKKQEANAFVKECITTALIKMMQEHSFGSISITNLVELAGVARVSFYRNFTSKEDVIKQHLDFLIQKWGAEFEKTGSLSTLNESLAMHYYNHRDFYLLLYRHNLSAMIYENIREALHIDSVDEQNERFRRAVWAGAIFGWLDEWARQGMPLKDLSKSQYFMIQRK